jgi:bifunctional ADP-heptose synthase (sugar kinase/adenylyltransferase)
VSDTNDEMWAHTLHVEHELGECRKRLSEARAALREVHLTAGRFPDIWHKRHAAALKAARESQL